MISNCTAGAVRQRRFREKFVATKAAAFGDHCGASLSA